VTVVYALPGRAVVREVRLAQGATVAEALAASGVTEEFPELVRQRPALGIFSVPVSGEHVLSDGDRVEIYRPLQADPKETRRRRAAHRRARGRPGGSTQS